MASEVVRDVLRTLDVEESMLDIDWVEDDVSEGRSFRAVTGDLCDHLEAAGHPTGHAAQVGSAELVCEECVRLGAHWVSLRRCLACGMVACCDSSPYKHATEHFHDSTHPVMQSAQPGEDWRWCFVHHVTA